MNAKPLKLPCRFQLGTTVYFRMSQGGPPGIVIQVRFDVPGNCVYTVAWGDNRNSTYHYEAELSEERDWSTPGESGGDTEE